MGRVARRRVGHRLWGWRVGCGVVSNSAANDAVTRSGRGVIMLVPVMSNTRSMHPFQVLLDLRDAGLARPPKAQAEQVRSVSITRVVRQLGWIGAEDMARIDKALRIHLSL